MFSSVRAQFTRTPLMFTGAQYLAGVLALCLAACLCSCGSKSSTTPTSGPLPNVAGSWEFIAVSNDNNYITGIEAAVKEGQVYVNGLPQPNGQFSADNNQIAFVSLEATSSQNFKATGFGGPCQTTTTQSNSLSGSVTADAAPMNFSFMENGVLFNVTGTLSGDGQSFLSGTYTQSGTSCADSGGTITGQIVSKLSGQYAGQICQPSSASCTNFPDAVTATLSENSSSTLSVTLAITGGPDAGANFTLQGPATGNAFSVQGTFQGQLITYYGYYEPVGATSSSVYLVNATTDPDQPTYVGTLPLVQAP